MKKILVIGAMSIALTGCGYSARDVEVVGQVKRVVHATPMICDDYNVVDLSLGVMRNGTGSMSTQDIWLTVPDQDTLNVLKNANETGKLVKMTYDAKRITFCTEQRFVTKAEILK